MSLLSVPRENQTKKKKKKRGKPLITKQLHRIVIMGILWAEQLELHMRIYFSPFFLCV